MATDPVALMALDNASQNAIAPYTPPDGLDLNPYMVPMTSLLETIQNQLPWVPQNLASVAAQVFAAGAFPRLRSFTGYSTAQLPSWVQLPANLQAWQQIIQQYQPIDNAFIAQNNALLAQQAAALQSNVDFWNSVAYYSGEDAVERIWADLQNGLDTLKMAATNTQLSMGVIAAIQNQFGAQIPVALQQQITALTATYQGIKGQVQSALAQIPGALQYVGLGVFPIVLTVALTVVAAVSASVWIYAKQMAAAQVQAATLATNLVAWRDQQSEQDLRSGKITETQFEQRQTQSNAMLNTIEKASGGSTTTKILEYVGGAIGLGLLGWLTVKLVRRIRARA
jgi:hypothetical protein